MELTISAKAIQEASKKEKIWNIVVCNMWYMGKCT